MSNANAKQKPWLAEQIDSARASLDKWPDWMKRATGRQDGKSPPQSSVSSTKDNTNSPKTKQR